ncbi:hypothetical protein DFJ58DRAFT_778314 [Suillus subalutaceus]|uniref:uncharacterized protein n=1 Tax=Suillus subalutaceus TaxID=48586 RepID=UPI001B86CDB8|nr:uncharacterized protein DFJ58DRAFT_778314 [Suillus subalutaceus]KAG1860641.1 hypothetical protein DFJ58DRAFT_778314 [Suillus subalutaceus]
MVFVRSLYLHFGFIIPTLCPHAVHSQNNAWRLFVHGNGSLTQPSQCHNPCRKSMAWQETHLNWWLPPQGVLDAFLSDESSPPQYTTADAGVCGTVICTPLSHPLSIHSEPLLAGQR